MFFADDSVDFGELGIDRGEFSRDFPLSAAFVAFYGLCSRRHTQHPST